MSKINLVQRIEDEVKTLFESEGTGHDWYHINRVRKNALKIAEREGGDLEIIELAALLHDIADHKFHNHDLSVGTNRASAMILEETGSEELASKISLVVSEISYKGACVATPVSSVEAAIVQDADRLDALGAIGIARAFAYGGHKSRPLYDPEVEAEMHTNFDDYAKKGTHTINHFYEKLLLLKDRMNTETGKEMAAQRHRFMEEFLNRFYEEWQGGQ